MPDTNPPEEELTPEEQAFLADPDTDRHGWRLPSPEAETPPPPPPGRAGASDPGSSTEAGTDTNDETVHGRNS